MTTELHNSVDLICGAMAADLHDSLDLFCGKMATKLHNSVDLICGTMAAKLPKLVDVFCGTMCGRQATQPRYIYFVTTSFDHLAQCKDSKLTAQFVFSLI